MVHTFWPVTIQRSPSRSARVASDARSEPAPGSLNSWHHFSSLRTIGGRKRSRCSSVPCANSAGAARLRPSGLSRPRLNGAQLLLDARARPRATGRARRTRPATSARRGPDAANTGYHASYSARVRTARTAAAPPARPASIHARGTLASTHARTASTASASLVSASIASRGRSRSLSALEVRARASRGTRPCPRGSRRCATTARARTPRCAAAARATRRARVQQPLREPERDGRARRELRRPARRPRASSSARRHRRVDRAPLRRLGARELAPEQQQLARAHLADAPRQQPRRAAVGREAALARTAPRTRASSAAIVKSAASASGNPMPAAQPRTLHTTGTWTSQQQRDQPVRLRRAAGAGCSRRAASARRVAGGCARRCRRRRRSGRPRRRARSRARGRRSTAAVERVDETRASSRRRSRCACRAGRA